MRRLPVLFACTILLWAIVSQLNHGLTGMRISLFVGALFVTFAALTQPFLSGLLAAMLSGLVFDAHAPIAFGTHLVLFAATHLMVYRIRERIPRHDTVTRVTVAVLANLALFLVFSFTQIIRSPAVSALWPRLLVDLACSQVFIAVAGPWYFALQARSLVLAGAEREHFA